MKKSKLKKVIFFLFLFIFIILAIILLQASLYHHPGKPFDNSQGNFTRFLCEFQESFYRRKGRYAFSLEELDQEFKTDLLEKKKDLKLEIFFTQKDFIEKYPDLKIDFVIEVTPNAFTIVSTKNYDRDPTPNVRMITNDYNCFPLVKVNDRVE